MLVVLIHQGLVPLPGTGGYEWHGPLRDILARLDPDIDVVVSGHTHNFSNALLPGRGAAPILVTQAYSYGVALAQIDLRIDAATRSVVAKSAVIVPTWADAPPGLPGDPAARRLTAAAQRLVAASVGRVVGTLALPMTRALTAGGESALGDLVADAQRAATHADMALMNPGGLRSDLRAGPVTWGDILTLHPFANRLITFDMTGAQLLAVLEQQWPLEANALPRILKTSGLYYSWDAARPRGARIVEACDAAYQTLDPAHHYRVTVNDFLANGGDDFTLFRQLAGGEPGPLDREALAQYLGSGCSGDACDAAANSSSGRTRLITLCAALKSCARPGSYRRCNLTTYRDKCSLNKGSRCCKKSTPGIAGQGKILGASPRRPWRRHADRPADRLRDAGGSGAASSLRGSSPTMPPRFEAQRASPRQHKSSA